MNPTRIRDDFKRRDGSLFFHENSDYLDLRVILATPLGQKHLVAFCKMRYSVVRSELLCWCDIQTFRALKDAPHTTLYKKKRAMQIYEKYVQEGAPLFLAFLDDEARRPLDEAAQALDAEKLEQMEQQTTREEGGDTKIRNEILGVHDILKCIIEQLLISLEHQCFRHMSQSVLPGFKDSAEYAAMAQELAEFDKTQHVVSVADFNYFDILGSGGFGRVVLAQKKSTRMLYAMKIQPKVTLIGQFGHDPNKLQLEKSLCASLKHPNIVSLHYAFQTEQHAIFCLSYEHGGDLAGLLAQTKRHRETEKWGLPIPQVRQYVAQIASALNYLHSKGFVYRDLKPANVLLSGDGQVALADMGLAIALDPTALKEVSDHGSSKADHRRAAKPTECCVTMSPQTLFEEYRGISRKPSISPKSSNRTPRNSTSSDFDPQAGVGQNVAKKDDEVHDASSVRSFAASPAHDRCIKTVAGTCGYMAYEVLADKLQTNLALRQGYGVAADYWSLGVCMYELTVGKMPFKWIFTPNTSATFSTMKAQYSEKEECYSPRRVAEAEMAGAAQALQFPRKVPQDAQDVISALLEKVPEDRMCYKTMQDHAFMTAIDWEKLTNGQMESEYIPDVDPPGVERPLYRDFDDVMEAFEKEVGHDQPTAFSDWHATPEEEDNGEMFESWNYVDPDTVNLEVGVMKLIESSKSHFW
jgi:serine/threonine protein kinase